MRNIDDLPANSEPLHHDCVAAALALHELTGWPLLCFFAYEVDLEARVLAAHAVVDSPQGYFDLSGPDALERWWASLQLEDQYGFCALVDVAIRPVTASYMKECLSWRTPLGDPSGRGERDLPESLALAHATLRQCGFAGRSRFDDRSEHSDVPALTSTPLRDLL